MRVPLYLTALPSTLKPSLTRLTACSLLLGSVLCGPLIRPAAAEVLDNDLPAYRPTPDVSGSVSCMGSTTMTSVAGIWMGAIKQYHPGIQEKLEVRGSRGAVDAVIAGEADFGLLSRSITKAEVEKFEQRFGYPPHVLTCCLEHMAIYVHESNPIRSISLQQIHDVFTGKAKTWGDLGVTGQWATQPILTHGRGDQTGSRVFLEQQILGNSPHRVRYEHDNNHDLVAAIAETSEVRGIGYAGLIYKLPGVKAVAVRRSDESSPVAIDSLAAASGQYPLMRPLQVVVNQKPDQKLAPAPAEFLKYVFSRSGQEDVIKGGFQPITSGPARVALDTIGLGRVR